MKLYIVGIERYKGTDEVVGIFDNQVEAMYVASEVNAQRDEDVKDVYTQEHELQSNETKLMNLEQFDKFIKGEEDTTENETAKELKLENTKSTEGKLVEDILRLEEVSKSTKKLLRETFLETDLQYLKGCIATQEFTMQLLMLNLEEYVPTSVKEAMKLHRAEEAINRITGGE